MKIVINKCFGGFSLSPAGVKRYAELQGKKAYFYDYDSKKKWKRLPDNFTDNMMWFAFDVDEIPTDDNREWWAEHHITNRPDDRSDPLLIQVIEELGEKASGQHAKLRIVKIPDNTAYSIEDYDGMEHVAEQHRTWS